MKNHRHFRKVIVLLTIVGLTSITFMLAVGEIKEQISWEHSISNKTISNSQPDYTFSLNLFQTINKTQ